jgi:MoxR-like ATPase
MQFTPSFFDPRRGSQAIVDGDETVTAGSGTAPGDVYVYTPEIILAINVALATKRPLLISGEPGSGKTTLARNAATVLDWWFFKETVTSRTRASDLLWTFDTLRRLNDASTPGAPLLDRRQYVEPGTLWWAFDPVSAANRGSTVPLATEQQADNPGQAPSTGESSAAAPKRDVDAIDPPPDHVAAPAVVLLDEVDKADPDVPNDLLEPFDIGEFTVKDTGNPIRRTRKDVLLVMTTNGERDLPPAFLRRCVTLALLQEPTDDWFVKIAARRYGREDPLMRDVAREVLAWRKTARDAGVRRPGTAEFLDAYAACTELGVSPGTPAWQQIARSVLWKQEKDPPSQS